MHQDDLRFAGTVTGYLHDNNSTAILSIPSFDSDVGSFSSVLIDFTERAAGAKRVIIDLQQNTGGQISLALEAYRQVRILATCPVFFYRIADALPVLPGCDSVYREPNESS